MKVNNHRIWFFLTITVLAALLAGCSGIRPGSAFNSGSLETVAVERGPMTVMIGATGTVRSAQTANMTWQTSGRVGEVKATLQQQVKAGEILASLDPTSLAQNILQAQVDLINAQNSLDDLMKPNPLQIAQAQEALDQAQTQLDNLLNPSPLALAEAEIALLNAQDAFEKAQTQVDRLSRGRGSAEQINLARANYLLAQDRVDQMQDVYNNTPGNSDEDPAKAMALGNLEGAKTDRDRALANLNWYLGSPSETEVAEKEADLALAQARLEEAESNLADLQNPTETTLALARARVEDAQETLDKLLHGPAEDDLTIAQTRVTQAQASLNQASLAAPFDGIVTEMQVLPGDLVSPGIPAFRIDDLSVLYVDLEVSEVDIHLVQVGQPVSIEFDAILDYTYQGEVVRIGQVGTATQGAVSFIVTVRLLDPDPLVRSGMTAIANITVAQEDDILQLPSRAIQEQSGKRFVYVLPAGGSITDARQVFVQVGLASDTSSEVISSELKEGDQVLLNAPGFFFMGGGNGMGGSGARP